MVGFARWCIAHRRWVIVGWIVVAIGSTVIAGAVGRQYSTNFSLPGTEAQHVTDLLRSEFKSQSGDVDTIVFHTANGTVDYPHVRAAIEPLLAKVADMPHVVSVVSPYTSAGAVEVSRPADGVRDGQLRQAREPPARSDRKARAHRGRKVDVPGLKIAAGGQVIEQAEGFSIGPATSVGVLAALVILLLTFGSLYAAGMPLITAGSA